MNKYYKLKSEAIDINNLYQTIARAKRNIQEAYQNVYLIKINRIGRVLDGILYINRTDMYCTVVGVEAEIEYQLKKEDNITVLTGIYPVWYRCSVCDCKPVNVEDRINQIGVSKRFINDSGDFFEIIKQITTADELKEQRSPIYKSKTMSKLVYF